MDKRHEKWLGRGRKNGRASVQRIAELIIGPCLRVKTGVCECVRASAFDHTPGPSFAPCGATGAPLWRSVSSTTFWPSMRTTCMLMRDHPIVLAETEQLVGVCRNETVTNQGVKYRATEVCLCGVRSDCGVSNWWPQMEVREIGYGFNTTGQIYFKTVFFFPAWVHVHE